MSKDPVSVSYTAKKIVNRLHSISHSLAVDIEINCNKCNDDKVVKTSTGYRPCMSCKPKNQETPTVKDDKDWRGKWD